MAVLVLIGWYGAGFLAATHLVRRGHDATVVTFAAALTGAMVVLVAVVFAVQRSLRPAPAYERTSGPDLTLVVDHDPDAALSAVARCDPVPGSVALVGLLSHEARVRWIDTGELAEARRRIAVHRARMPLSASEALVTGEPAALAELGSRLVVLPRDRSERSRRHDAWRVLRAARTCGAPVLSPVTLRRSPTSTRPLRSAPAERTTA